MSLRVVTVLGTRPEIIKLSRVMPAIDRLAEQVIIHTGQNRDAGLHDVFFRELGLRRPDHQLDVSLSSFHDMASDLFREVGSILASVKPDAFLILGDTNSALTAIVARKMDIPIFHMEAGNRCFSRKSPEEVNRRIIDHISDINLVYTEAARRNLLAEGVAARRIYLTGSPLAEVLSHFELDIKKSSVLDRHNLEPGNYIAVSLHRQENVDDLMKLRSLFESIEEIAKIYGKSVVVTTHPRTRQRLGSIGYQPPKSTILADPFGLFDWCHLQSSAACVVSDSGTVSEESAMLGFPAVIMRDYMERPEAMDSGHVVLAGTTLDGLRVAIKVALELSETKRAVPPEYAVMNTAERVAKIVVGACKVSTTWSDV